MPDLDPDTLAACPAGAFLTTDTEDLPMSTTGPLGGTTTRSSTAGVRKNFWMPEELAERLRQAAFEHRLPEAVLIRSAIAWRLDALDNLSVRASETEAAEPRRD